jgi:hypothetical protein
MKVKDMEVVVNYMNDVGVDLMTKDPVPLVYDYGCSKGFWKCEWKYYSFNGKDKSYDVSDYSVNNLDPKNLHNFPFTF